MTGHVDYISPYAGFNCDLYAVYLPALFMNHVSGADSNYYFAEPDNFAPAFLPLPGFLAECAGFLRDLEAPAGGRPDSLDCMSL